MCLRITTTKEVERVNQEFKEMQDEISMLRAENNELEKVINRSYNRLNNYTVAMLSDYRKIINEAKKILEPKAEKKFADEILPHYINKP